MELRGVAPFEIIRPLLGTPAWGIRLGVGSFLTVEFGAPEVASPAAAKHGELHLWLYMCAWRIEKGEHILAGSDDDRPEIEAALQDLEFGDAEQVELVKPSLDLRVQFRSGARLVTFAASSAHDQAQWMLFTPNGYCLTVFGDGSYEHTPRTAPRPRSLHRLPYK